MNDGDPLGQSEIRDHGQIAQMELPEGWVEGPPHTFSVGTRSFRELHPVEAPRFTLCFYYRGLLIPEAAGKAFHELLEKPAHVLSRAELQSVGEVLRDKARADDFNTSLARTEDLNGKRVLVVAGCYPRINEETVEVFVDARGDGRAVQEIYYQAPQDVFSQHAKAAKNAIRSIRWK